MTKRDLAKLYVSQKSLTEWLEDIQHKNVAELRDEDNEKRERLRVLNEVTGLPFDKPTQFSGEDLAAKTSEVKAYLENHGDELCALRLMPLDKSLPKLRMRGKTVADAYEWFKEQNVDPSMYRADFVPHSDSSLWATICVVNKNGITGEIIRGGHHQLTQGMYDHEERPYTFHFDFSDWLITPESDKVRGVLENIVSNLKVPNEKQGKLSSTLNATFANDYLEGYFETTESEEFGMWFIDYAPKMGKLLEGVSIASGVQSDATLTGQVGSKGQAEGLVKIVLDPVSPGDFAVGDVLVCSVTTPDYVPLMQKAAAIVTDEGGILSHAAIVARELKKPCIVGTQYATSLLKNGQKVRVDAEAGQVFTL